ncbi:MAG: DUF4131 domain-containing protein [Phyllobacteriaceae bacterium]|nr:DUF4131 domain-containing protein [Phyllobacteriaceae bacterium]
MSRETAPIDENTRSRIAFAPARRAWLAFAPGGPALRLSEAARRLLDGADADLANGAGPALTTAVFACGIALYFSLPSEPWAPALVAVALIALALTMVRRRRGVRAIGAIVVTALLAGAAIAALSTRWVAAPRLDRERTVSVEGRVIDLDATAKGGTRLGLEVARMEGTRLSAADVPAVITATLARGRPAPAMGDTVAFKARLKPPDGPVLPDGYDFARRAWFDGRGAGGYVLGRAHPVDLGARPLLDRLLAPIGDLRHAVADRVRTRLPGGTGAIGAALMVGEQRAIPDAVNDPLRASGLTHIVSISGLHMSLVAGGVMVVLRFLFVAIPGFAMHRSAKKAAAVAALLAATIYLFLSGLQVAAVRSHLMLSVALIAVLVDRPAITMHTVAVAATAILLIDPEAAMEPSFRMSFLAVIALVASWDLWKLRVAARPPPSREASLPVHLLGAARRHVEGLAFSSLIAGLATAPVIVGVFYRGAPYSILANMIVLPVVGILVMPAAVVAALAMPFGFDELPLAAMGLGIDFMVAVGRWVSALPGGAGLVGAPHPLAMPLGVAAVLWLSLWRSRIRLLGLVPGLLSLVLAALGPQPDVLVGRHGSPVAVRGDDGRLHVLAGRDDRFDVAIWLAADADDRSPDDRGLAAGWRCDAIGCVFRRDGGGASGPAPLEVAVVRDPRGFPEDCAAADLVISRLVAPPGCGAATTVVDRARLAETGAIALTVVGTSPPPQSPDLSSPRPPVDPTAPDEAEDLDIRPDPAFAIGASDPHRSGAPTVSRAGIPPIAPTAAGTSAGRENRRAGPTGAGPGAASSETTRSPSSGTPRTPSPDTLPDTLEASGLAAADTLPRSPATNSRPPSLGSTLRLPPTGRAPTNEADTPAPPSPATIGSPPAPRPPAVIASSPELPTRPILRFTATASLPAGGRPWSPRDPDVPRLVESVTPIAVRSTEAQEDAEPSLNNDGSAPPADPEP